MDKVHKNCLDHNFPSPKKGGLGQKAAIKKTDGEKASAEKAATQKAADEKADAVILSYSKYTF